MRKEIKISYDILERLAVLYLLMPIIIFMLTWIKLPIGIVMSFILLIGYGCYSQRTPRETEYLVLSIKALIGIVIFCLLWVISTGIGNFFVSGFDETWRNAVFRDLINYSWPVIYENGNSLVYYLFFWMVPAIVGKLFGWTVANIALVCWTTLGIILISGLIAKIVHVKAKAEIICLILIFWSWGGLDVVGAIIAQILNVNAYSFGLWDCNVWTDYFFNGHPFNYQYRTNCNALANVFNQAVPAWIATVLCYINKDRLFNYIFLGSLMLPFAPLPFVGLVFILVTYYLFNLIRKKINFIKSLREILSIQNVITLLTIFPIVALYFGANSTTAGDEGGGFSFLPIYMMDKKMILITVIFYLLEFVVISMLIYKDNKRNAIFYIINIWLLCAIFVVFGKGSGRDFSMNATMPAFFLLMILTIRYIIKNVLPSKINSRNLLIGGYVFFMSLSPLFYVLNGLDQIGDLRTFPIVKDEIVTFSDKDANDGSMFYYNFLNNKTEETVFYKYIARNK